MLPERGTETTVYRGDGPYYVSGNGFMDTFPGRDKLTLPMVAARREAVKTTFIALHEPFDATSRPSIAIQCVDNRPDVVRLQIGGESFQDSLVCTRHVGHLGPGPAELDLQFTREVRAR